MPTLQNGRFKVVVTGATGGVTSAAQEALNSASQQVALATIEAGEASASAAIAENWAQSVLSATGGAVVTELTQPVPANGSVEILLVPNGSQVWQVVLGAWKFVDWFNRAPNGAIKTSDPTTDTTLTNIKLVPFQVDRATVVNRIDITVTESSPDASLFEIGIYSEAYARLSTSGVRETTSAGRQTVSLPDTALAPGKYFFAIATNSASFKIAVNDFAGGVTATNAFPLPATPGTPALASQAPSVTVKEKGLPPTQGLFEIENNRVNRVYGIDEDLSQPWALNTSTFKMSVSLSSGATFEDRMPVPPGALDTGGGIADLIVHEGRLYVLCNKLTLYRSSDLSASATWADISCPIAPGLRSADAFARPYGLGVIGGHVFIGEYTNAPNEVRTTGQDPGPDPTRGPRILRLNLATMTWALSKEFLEARHVHSFFQQGTAALWVSLGDAGWGNQIGVHRLVPADMLGGVGGTDIWRQWTSPVAPRTDHYPIDFLLPPAASFNGESWDQKLLLTSDRPGYHLLQAALTGTVEGSVNMAAHLFQKPSGPSGETARSLIIDTATKNAFYWTSETTEPALYMSPPPYNQAIKLADFPDPNHFRAVYSGGYVMMFETRFKVEKMVGQV